MTGLGKIDRVFLYSLVVSALFHLSMITLFSIEMRYELRPIRYYPFDIVDVSRLTPPAPADDSLLTLPGGPSPFGERPEGEDILASIPEISLPVMPFEDFGTITLRQPELSLDPRLTGEAGRPRDAWARFGREIQDLRDTLKGLPLFDDLGGTPQRSGLEVDVMPGVRGRIEWLGEPRDRELLLSAPAIAPLEAGPPGLSSPVAILFRVDREGKVHEVLSPPDTSDGVVSAAADALRQYRFEVLTDGRGGLQSGTLTLLPSEEGGP